MFRDSRIKDPVSEVNKLKNLNKTFLKENEVLLFLI